jgi:hypothetical protein
LPDDIVISVPPVNRAERKQIFLLRKQERDGVKSPHVIKVRPGNMEIIYDEDWFVERESV